MFRHRALRVSQMSSAESDAYLQGIKLHICIKPAQNQKSRTRHLFHISQLLRH
jgi:hypothetical protein